VNYTPNLNLKKPAKTDPVLIDDLNDNMDILDQEVKGIRDIINQEVQNIQGVIDQEVGGIRDVLDNLFVEEGESLDE
jgi:hypothetical protein